MATPPAEESLPDAEAPAVPMLALAKELHEDIFLRVADRADLASASAACGDLRRLIVDPSFLRRHRALHPPLLLGFLNYDCFLVKDPFRPVASPQPGARAASALARAADFSFHYYLPPGRWGEWACCDVRDGRVLLQCGHRSWEAFAFPDLAVCDPLSRQYLMLPPIPDYVLASAQVRVQTIQYLEALLVPRGHEEEEDEEEETSFKVIGRTHGGEKTVIFIFSSGSGQWNVGTSIRWSDLKVLRLDVSPHGFPLELAHYDHGCFYWKLHCRNNMLKLDFNEMEFSTVNLPPDHCWRDVVLFEAGEGMLAMFSHVRDATSVNYYIMQHEGEGANEWQMKRVISLPGNFTFVGARQGYLFLLIYKREGAGCYSLDTKTFELERIRGMDSFYGRIHPYFGFPPSMSPRRI